MYLDTGAHVRGSTPLWKRNTEDSGALPSLSVVDEQAATCNFGVGGGSGGGEQGAAPRTVVDTSHFNRQHSVVSDGEPASSFTPSHSAPELILGQGEPCMADGEWRIMVQFSKRATPELSTPSRVQPLSAPLALSSLILDQYSARICTLCAPQMCTPWA
jgi:hypothetical protein